MHQDAENTFVTTFVVIIIREFYAWQGALRFQAALSGSPSKKVYFIPTRAGTDPSI